MANRINVTFLHPTTGNSMEVEVDISLTADAIIDELITSLFIPDIPNNGCCGYYLLNKETNTVIRGSETLADAEVSDGAEIRVMCWSSPG